MKMFKRKAKLTSSGKLHSMLDTNHRLGQGLLGMPKKL
jgi:hypothetical protein